mmetsp:Transcript_38232/g.89757  ORF Transcript_38232/g.89757 Transcript_38232/m.89757 type:complete len:235 (-) Transcript_38232:897-1601(-)
MVHHMTGRQSRQGLSTLALQSSTELTKLTSLTSFYHLDRWTACPGAFQESVSPRISTSIMRWRSKAACMSFAPEMRRSRWHASSELTANISLHRGTMPRYLIGSKQTAPRSSAYASEKAILWMMPELWMIRLKTFNRIWEPLGAYSRALTRSRCHRPSRSRRPLPTWSQLQRCARSVMLHLWLCSAVTQCHGMGSDALLRWLHWHSRPVVMSSCSIFRKSGDFPARSVIASCTD